MLSRGSPRSSYQGDDLSANLAILVRDGDIKGPVVKTGFESRRIDLLAEGQHSNFAAAIRIADDAFALGDRVGFAAFTDAGFSWVDFENFNGFLHDVSNVIAAGARPIATD